MKLNNVVFVLVLASTLCVSFGGMLPNGDFEISPSALQLTGTKVNGRYAIPKWVSKGFVEYITEGAQQGDMVLVIPEGKHAVRLGNNASIRQKVRVAKGRFYALTFSFARTCSQDETLNITISPNHKKHGSGLLPLQTIYSHLGHDAYAWGFRAESSVIEITFHNMHHPGEDLTCGPIIDNVALVILDDVKATGGNLIKNGEFGQGPYVSHHSATGVLIPSNIKDNQSPLPAWMIESHKAVKYIDSLHFFVPEGQRAIELIGGKESSIAQTIRTKVGESYVLTFLVGDAKNECVGPLAVEAFAGEAMTTINYHSKGEGGFIRGQLLFTPKKPRTRIRFMSSFYTMTNMGSMCGPVIDDVKVRTTHYHSRIHT
ncbi:BIIDXI-like protein At5g11420 [Silene latifolia]|uniref:BIIDXI-like protein At5g11420 n=1 Tax=Silene latifolia TaxID=37657 RepID=UPI003D787389